MASSSCTERKLPDWLMKAAADEEWGEGEKGKAGPNTPTKGKGKKRKENTEAGDLQLQQCKPLLYIHHTQYFIYVSARSILV